jgi:hypothetical protein
VWRQRRTVDRAEGHQTRIHDVKKPNRAIGLDLHDPALKELHLSAEQREGSRRRKAEGLNPTALVEEVEEAIIGNPESGLDEEARVQL